MVVDSHLNDQWSALCPAGWGIAFGDTVLEGEMSFGTAQELVVSSGAPLVRFPPDGLLVAGTLRDQGEEVLSGGSSGAGGGAGGGTSGQFPILGTYQVRLLKSCSDKKILIFQSRAADPHLLFVDPDSVDFLNADPA